uniref:Uncharacterized protein n=1 Tax=Candidatus Nitrotoga fabula TaxID=2182327 RepID=A0A2X0RB95_9PROT|nr:protein of unknown function [Candidatus Nitrotoga fabula]
MPAKTDTLSLIAWPTSMAFKT